MRSIHFLNVVLIQEAGFDDAFSAFAGFFGALEQADECTGEVTVFSHISGCAHQPCLVTVMAAGMCVAFNLRAPFFFALVLHLKSVDVSAESDGLAGEVAFNFDKQRAGARGVIHVFGRNIVFFKEFLDFSDGSLSFKAAVGMLMNIVAMGN